MLLTLVLIFVVGYMLIALEHPLKIDKSATALLLGMGLWVLYGIFSPTLIPQLYPEQLAEYAKHHASLAEHPGQLSLSFLLHKVLVLNLGEIAETIFFLIGAMTIVEIIDVHGGFSVITSKITTRRKRLLLVIVCCITFFLSALLDNLTTTIVMLMLLRKIIPDQKERWLFAGMVIIAANTGGAWSPIGDVTTIMLWVKGNVTTGALISHVLLPSIVALAVPLTIVLFKLKGQIEPVEQTAAMNCITTQRERTMFLCLGISGLVFVPIFKSLTHQPPFIGVLLSLSVLWIFTEIFYNRKSLDCTQENRVGTIIKRIDISTLIFFFGILMAVSALQSSGILATAAAWLDENVRNVFAINIILGALSSIVDNVPLVAAAMGMYPVAEATATGYTAYFMVDGIFWEFLSYCAGVGGSILIIGSASGVIAMGIEKIPFGWYLKRFSLLAILGYLAGAGVYILTTII